MQSKEQIESFRKMRPTERWEIVRELMEFAWKYLKQLSPEDCERRLKFAREEHDKSNNILAKKLRMMK